MQKNYEDLIQDFEKQEEENAKLIKIIEAERKEKDEFLSKLSEAERIQYYNKTVQASKKLAKELNLNTIKVGVKGGKNG